MVEIGFGLVVLIELVGECFDQLIVIELDCDLVVCLQMYLFFGLKLIIYQQDVMIMNFGELVEKMGQLLCVFGNLLYNILILLMFYLFSYIDVIVDMYFMLQKEVVNCLVVGLNSKVYGWLSVMV